MFFLIISFLSLFLGYVLFYLYTKQTIFVRVIKKFQINIGNKKVLKIQDDNNNEYIISDGLFISEKKALELWNKVKEDELNYITFYGVNAHVLNLTYNIIDVR